MFNILIVLSSLVLFAGYAMVWLIEQFQAYLDASGGDTHPAPSLRLQNLFRTSATDILPLDPALPRLHADVLEQFDVIRARIPQMYGTADLISQIKDPELMGELMSFDAQANDIKSALRDFEFSAKY